MAVNINLRFTVNECDECIFYYYSDLKDVCIMLKEEIPYEDAVNGIHPNCPFWNDKMRYTVYWNERQIVVFDLLNQSRVVATDEVTELQKKNCKIIAMMLNRRAFQ